MFITKKQRNVLIASALVWMGIAGSTAHALLSDSSVLTGNSLLVGSANLLVSNSQSGSSTTYEKAREGFSFALVPGQSDSRYFLLKNTSTTDVPLEIKVGAMITKENINLGNAYKVSIVAVDSDGNPIVNATVVTDSLQKMATTDGALKLWGSIPKGTAQRYKMTAALDAAYPYPAETITYDLLFTGVQKVN